MYNFKDYILICNFLNVNISLKKLTLINKQFLEKIYYSTHSFVFINVNVKKKLLTKNVK